KAISYRLFCQSNFLYFRIIKFMSDKNIDIKKYDLEKFFEYSIDMLCIADMGGYFLTVNKAFAKNLGYSKEEMIHHHCTEFTHPDDIEITLDELAKLDKGQLTIKFENR